MHTHNIFLKKGLVDAAGHFFKKQTKKTWYIAKSSSYEWILIISDVFNIVWKQWKRPVASFP